MVLYLWWLPSRDHPCYLVVVCGWFSFKFIMSALLQQKSMSITPLEFVLSSLKRFMTDGITLLLILALQSPRIMYFLFLTHVTHIKQLKYVLKLRSNLIIRFKQWISASTVMCWYRSYYVISHLRSVRTYLPLSSTANNFGSSPSEVELCKLWNALFFMQIPVITRAVYKRDRPFL